MARSGFVKLRVSPDEEARWRRTAAVAGLSLSKWLRGLAEMSVVTGTNGADLRAELAQLRASLNRGIGANLNQIARALNSDPAARRTSGAYVAKNLADASYDMQHLREVIEVAMNGLAGSARARRQHPKSPPIALDQPPAEAIGAKPKTELCPHCSKPRLHPDSPSCGCGHQWDAVPCKVPPPINLNALLGLEDA